MLPLTPALLAAVVTEALRSAAEHPRWVAAIKRASVELESNPWIEVQGSHLLIASGSGESYDVNGACQCAAFKNGQACWHRAARQIVARYVEAESKEEMRRKRKLATERATALLNETFA